MEAEITWLRRIIVGIATISVQFGAFVALFIIYSSKELNQDQYKSGNDNDTSYNPLVISRYTMLLASSFASIILLFIPALLSFAVITPIGRYLSSQPDKHKDVLMAICGTEIFFLMWGTLMIVMPLTIYIYFELRYLWPLADSLTEFDVK